MERRMKQIHAEMLALRNKETRGIKLSREERIQLGRLTAEHDSLAFELPVQARFGLNSPMRARAA